MLKNYGAFAGKNPVMKKSKIPPDEAGGSRTRILGLRNSIKKPLTNLFLARGSLTLGPSNLYPTTIKLKFLPEGEDLSPLLRLK